MQNISNELAEAVKPLETKLKWLWVGIFPSFVIYIFLAWKRAQMPARTEAPDALLPITVLLCGIVLIQSFVLRWFTLSPKGIAHVLKGRQPFWVKMIVTTRSQTGLKGPAPERLSEDEQTLYGYSGGLMNAVLIQWGMVNTCALFGMILPPAQYQPMAAAIAGVVSAACMFFHYPAIGRSFSEGLELAEFEKGMQRN